MSEPIGVLLFSGGLDSTALAARHRPALLLFVDYGQRSRNAERAAADKIASLLDLQLEQVELGIRDFGSGLLHGDATLDAAPSPEWWPYRNQFLASAAAAVALARGLNSVALGSVRTDGARHLDGTSRFYELLDALVAYQEGGIRVTAPGVDATTDELIKEIDADPSLLAWTYSCHRANLPCGECPGCWKRSRVLSGVGMTGYASTD